MILEALSLSRVSIKGLDCYLFYFVAASRCIAQKGSAKKSSAEFLSHRFTSEISTTSEITSMLFRDAPISGYFTCVKNRVQHHNRQTQDARI